MSTRAAISALGTRITFLIVAWLMVTRSVKLTDIAIVAGAQVLAYVIFRQVAQRLRPMTAAADLFSVVVLAAMSFYLSNVVVFAALAGVLGLLRAFGDRYPGIPPTLDDKPIRHTLIRVLLFLAGAGIGAAALWFGPVGALWANAMVFAVAAVLGTFEPAPPTPSAPLSTFDGRVLDGTATEVLAASEPAPAGPVAAAAGSGAVISGTVTGGAASATAASGAAGEGPVLNGTASPAGSSLASQAANQSGGEGRLRADPLVRRLAVSLFFTNLLVQAGAVLLVALWVQRVTQAPQLIGLIAAAFILGLLGGGLTFGGLTRSSATSMAIALGCLAGGAAAYVYLLTRPPSLLLVVAAALVTGVATASVVPLTGTLLSEHVPAPLRSKVDGMLASVSYIGIPLGTVAAAWWLPRTTTFPGLGAAAGAYLVATLLPVFIFRTWRKMLPEAPPALVTSGGRLPARLTVTLAYANGQWIVEVRRGRALLGSRHLVKSAEAMNMLAVLDVPGVQDSVEKALTLDQVEAARQAERMRSELAQLEDRLAGLTEMVEVSDANRPAPKQREGERKPEEEVAK